MTLAGDVLDADDAFVHRLMGEKLVPGHVAERVDARSAGSELLVDHDEAALVDLDADGVQADVL